MKKLILILLVFVMFFSISGCSGSGAKNTYVPPEDPYAERSREDIIEEAYFCIFPLEGSQNIEKAMELLLPLVEDGDAEAQYYYGWIYDFELEENDETEKESLYWYKLSMEQGYIKAYLGVSFNEFVESEDEKEELINTAIQHGLFDLTEDELGTDGLFLLFDLYRCGLAGEEDADQMERYLHMSVSESFCHPALIYLTNSYYYSEDYENYFKLLNKISIHKSPEFINKLGVCFENGLGIEQDVEKAVAYYQEAAELGSAWGMYNTGRCYGFGLGGLPESPEDAFEWYMKSAEAGLPQGMYAVGHFCENAYGTKYDYEAAMHWYIEAYLHGYEAAADNINSFLEKGRGINTYYERYSEIAIDGQKLD